MPARKERINGSVSVEIPESFHTMSSEELRRVFQDSGPERWGAWDRENHVMITVMWKVYPLLLAKLAGLKDVCRRNEQLSSKGYAGNGYQCEGFFSLSAGGLPAEGYRYSYSVGDVRQSAETVLVKKDRTIYSFTCTGRLENKAADHETFTGVVDGIRF